MSESIERRTRPGNTHGLTSPGTLNYGIIRSGSTRHWGIEPPMRSSGNGSTNRMQRNNRISPVREVPGSSNITQDTRCVTGITGTITNDHDPLGRPTTLTYPDHLQIGYS